MKALLSLSFALITYTQLSAQDSTFLTIKAGYRVTDILKPGDIYYYPQFTIGKVFFRDGSKAPAKLNYNSLFGQMLFVDNKGDTLALSDENTIKFIIINKDTFFFNQGYMRLFLDNGVVKLAEKQTWVVADVRKMGTHNRQANTFAVTSFSTYADVTNGSKSYDLILNEDIVLKKEIEYYFGDRYNDFIRTSKKGLVQIFAKDQQRIENYLKENKVNFDKKDDLEKLAQFLAQQN